MLAQPEGSPLEPPRYACCCESDADRSIRWKAEHTAEDEARTAAFLQEFRPDNYSFYRRAGHLYAKKATEYRAGTQTPAAAEMERL